jgi:TonB family protein
MAMLRWWLLLLLLCPLTTLAQSAPVLNVPGGIVYPPIARAAHVTGTAVVSFWIRDDGSTADVQKLSGPEMLSASLVSRISSWRFQTPLPMATSRTWTATVKFEQNTEDDDLEDDVSGPPAIPSGGDVIMISPSAFQITVHVTSGTGPEIAVNDKPSAAPDLCPQKHGVPPAATSSGDFVELDRRPEYRVRVYRDGRVEWHGNEDQGITVVGDQQSTIAPAVADRLFDRSMGKEFWDSCSIDVRPERDDDGDLDAFHYLTAQIGTERKTVNATALPLLPWAVDAAANTHQWRHGDASRELLRNLRGDLMEPKPGVTALMRATEHYNPSTARWSDAALRYQIAKGASLEATDESGWTALMYAAGLNGTCCDDTAVRLLVTAGADVNHASLHGDTPLMAVAYEGYLNGTLLKAGAKINARNADGVTVLMLLAQQLKPEPIAEALLAGADANAKDSKGRTAVDYLREASCDRAIVPLPIPWMTTDDGKPKPCPNETTAYRESEALLKTAMKQVASKK